MKKMNDCLVKTGRKTKKWLIARLTLFLLFSFNLASFAGAQTAKVDLRLKDVTLQKLCEEIQRQTDLLFVYNEELTKGLGVFSVEADQETVESVLACVLAGSGLTFRLDGEVIVIQKEREEPQVREVVVEGRVLMKDSTAIAGATIVVKGTTLGVASDADGRFKLVVPGAESIVLEVSFVGMKKQTVTVDGTATPKPLVVVMEEEAVDVDEVVVVGYGTTTARDLTGQVASLNESQLSKKNATNVETMLQNAAAGVVVSLASTNPAEGIRVRVRGESSLTGDNEPLYVVDGIPVSSDVLNTIAPSDIASMDVLKDASAAAIYGSRGANGVVIVTTKRGTSGKPTIDASYTYNVDVRRKNFDVLEAEEWKEFVRYVAENTLEVDPSNETANDIINDESTVFYDGNTNWYEEIYRPAERHDVTLSVRGGEKRSTYYISLGVMDYSGMIEHDEYTRYNGRINLDYDITDFLRFGTSTTIGYTDISYAGTSLYTAIGFRPDYPIYDEDGEYFYDGRSYNPVASNNDRSYSDNFGILSTSWLELDIWKGLKFKTSIALNQSMSYGEGYTPTYLTSDEEGSGTSRAAARSARCGTIPCPTRGPSRTSTRWTPWSVSPSSTRGNGT